MKKYLLLLAYAALLSTTNSFAECRKDTVNQFNVSDAGVKTSSARWISTFDSQGNQITELYQFYSNMTFENSKLTTNIYNPNNRVLSSLVQDYDAGTSLWVNNKKTELSYTGNNVADSAVFTWSTGISIWEEDVRQTYTYNAQGKMLSLVFKELTLNKQKREFTYDANGNETKNEFFSWLSGAWVPLNKEEKTYNAGNNVITLSNFNYNQGTMAYENASQFAYTYDANGNETLKESRNWNGSQYVAFLRNGKTWSNNNLTQTTVQFNDAGWVTVERDDYNYNANNLLSEMIRFRIIGGPTPTLVIDSRLNYTYNTAGQLTGRENQTYNVQTSQYTTTSDEVRNYSASGKLTRLFYANFSSGLGVIPSQEFLYEFNANDDLIATETKNGFNVNTGGWNSIVRQEYICGVNQVSGIASVIDIQFSVYPNPANESVSIENLPLGSQIKLVDIAGKIIYQSVVNNSIEKIDLQSIVNGIYFIIVLENGTLKGTSKLVVSK